MLQAVKAGDHIYTRIRQRKGMLEKVYPQHLQTQLFLESLEQRICLGGISQLDPTPAAKIIHQGYVHSMDAADRTEDRQTGAEVHQMFAGLEQRLVSEERKVKLIASIQFDARSKIV